MPRYDYQCESCGREFELIQSFGEAGSGTCPTCSGAGRRRFHAVPVIYKGSGFYTTDYARPKPPGGSSSKGGKATGGNGVSASDSKTTSGNGSSAGSESKSESVAKAADETKA